MELNFEYKVRSMTAKEIIMAMVNGLKNPAVEVRMDVFGGILNKLDGSVICVGCAATNTICNISASKVFTAQNIAWRVDRSAVLQSSYYFLDSFERAIDCLRKGNLTDYNHFMYNICGTKQLIKTDGFIGVFKKITDENYTDPAILQPYIDLANHQDKF